MYPSIFDFGGKWGSFSKHFPCGSTKQKFGDKMDEMTHIIIIGFGSQAKAWALNLKDSGENVHIALRYQSQSLATAKELGLKTLTLGPDLKYFRNFALLTPDHTHQRILHENREFIQKGSKIILAHGYSYTRHDLKTEYPDWDFLLFAPKAIASELRFQFESKGKLAAVMSTEGSKDPLDGRLIGRLAKSLGITAGPFETTFQDETFADLFSEQSILCSLLPYGALSSYKKLREKGISKEIAYLECWYEIKLIADAMVKMGPEKFFELISPNALFGGEKARKLLLDERFNSASLELLKDIWSEKFFREIDGTDFETLREEIIGFWRKEELAQTHQELKRSLF
jgi:ketol-acid reductoisomerase